MQVPPATESAPSSVEGRAGQRTARAWIGVRRLLPGLGVVAPIAAIAIALGHLVPVVGAPVFGIVLGVVVSTVLRRTTAPVQRLAAGASFSGKYVLQIAIVVLGAGLSLSQVGHTGFSSLPVMLGTLAVALVGAQFVGRLLGVRGDARTLIGVGTGICGASAIAATTAVIGAAEAEVAYAIATIFTFNVAAVLLFPALGHLLGLSQDAFGLWAGTAINDTSSVVAAATIYGSAAADYGVVVKLTRTLMIIPICVALGALAARKANSQTGRRNLPWRRMFPIFLLGFLLASALETAGVVPNSWHGGLRTTSEVLITAALTGIGLMTDPSKLRAAGARPLLLGGVLWVGVGVSSLLLQYATGTFS